jgi:CubicO group peptidase (beta-lactamase class C family)
MNYCGASVRSSVLLLGALALFTGGAANSAPPSEDALAEQVNHLLKPWNRSNAPGCAVGVIREGAFVYRGAFGLADVEAATSNTPATVFYLGSTAKQFTAACVAHLAANGRLGLDDEIRKYLPEMPETLPPVTVRHLVHHRSGVRDFYETIVLADLEPSVLSNGDDVIRLIASMKEVNFPPGSECEYSNSGYVLLAEIVRRVSGQSLRDYAATHLFAPLGMSSSQFRDDMSQTIATRALGYETRNNTFRRSVLESTLPGPGGMFSTLDDLARWDHNFYNPAWGDPNLIASLQTPPELADGQAKHPMFGDYAFGLLIGTYRGLRTVRHAGGAFGFQAELLRFPDERLSVICLGNSDAFPAADLAEQVAEVYLDGRMAKTEHGKKPPKEFNEYDGFYHDPRTGYLWALHLIDGKPRLGTLGFRSPLTYLGDRKLRTTDAVAPIEIALPQQLRGEATGMRLTLPGVPTFTAMRVERVRPAPTSLTDYAGTYRNEELGSSVHIEARNGTLLYRQRPGAIIQIQPFHPVMPDVFFSQTVGGIQLQFDRAGNGELAGFRISMARARNLRFVRQ